MKQLDVVMSTPANWFDCYKPYGFFFIWEIVIVPVDQRLQEIYFLCYEFTSSEFRGTLQTGRQTDKKATLKSPPCICAGGLNKMNYTIANNG